ncbi:MAG: hypothetical protein WCP35_09700 [Verrucomicrobiota bacterium]
MKKFLPLLPAFLLCFAGGASLGRLRPKPATSPAACYLIIPDEKAQSYDSWLKSYKEKEASWTAHLHNKALFEKEKNDKLTPQDLQNDLNTYKQGKIRDQTFGDWLQSALEPPEFKALGVKTLACNQLQDNIKDSKLGWDDRIKIYADFSLREKEHAKMLVEAEKARLSLIAELSKLQNP